LSKTFTLTRAEVADADAASLKAEIASVTGSELETASILRSLERLGTDPSIEYYEMTQVTGKRMHGGAATIAWRVRADRGVAHDTAL
jgi:hypothetical protein